MTALRTAVQQALEALEEYQSNGAPFLTCDGAIDALRAALAQQDEPVQEPVQEPEGLDWRYTARIGYVVKPYTAPPQRKPLTDEEILKAIGWERAEMYMKLTPNFPVAEAKKETLKNARAIERAHGIGETK